MEKIIKEKGLERGFDGIGITTAAPLNFLEFLNDAIDENRIADMRWLARNPSGRCDPKALLPDANSVICCALSYGENGFGGDGGLIDRRRARYAQGLDYHDLIHAMLSELLDSIRMIKPDVKGKICVDTSPILEKGLAERAGLGWIGKHTILVNEKLGSRFMLGEIITNLELKPDDAATNRCGNCRACIDACPTAALLKPGKLDARRCISYLTIESKETVPPEFKNSIEAGQYGCDICQEACPYNVK